MHTDRDEDAATILFLAANPMGNAALDQGEEYRAIENRIRAATYSPRIQLRPRLAARPDDLLEALLRDTPAVLHFSGHGGGHVGLCFRGDDGRAASVSADGLTQVMLGAGETIKLVVLNACYSEVQARALVAHVPCVIGTPGPIEDRAAISYAAAFYRALAYGRSVGNAHQNGKAALALHASAGGTRDVELAATALRTPHPTLLTRQGVDADRIHLVAREDGPGRAPPDGDHSTVQFEIVIDAKLEMLTPEIVARMVSELGRLGGGLRVRILFVTSGSVRLTLAAPDTALRAIRDRWTGGELPRLCGLPVIDVIELGDVSVAFELACPYPGMRPFSDDEAAQLFGREREIDDILARLRRGEREVHVVGSRGVGKSSLIAAGVLPRWARSGEESPRPVVCTVLPGDHPIARIAGPCDSWVARSIVDAATLPQLSQAFADLLASPIQSLLLFVDQLEDLFTADPEHCAVFCSALQELRADGRCVLVFALRAECFGRYIESELWTSADRRQCVELAPLRYDALYDAICRPAHQLGVVLEPGLVDCLAADTARASDALPLLQFVLRELWPQRCGSVLPLSAYLDLQGDAGRGLAGALAKHADASIHALGAAQQRLALELLRDLAPLGESGVHARAPRRLDELRAVPSRDATDLDFVMQQLIEARLIRTIHHRAGNSRVELAHEGLIAAWPMFASFLERRRGQEQRRRDLEAAASAWRWQRTRSASRSRRRARRDDSALALGASPGLDDPAITPGLSDNALAFVAAARSQTRRRARLASALTAGLAIAALFLGIDAWSSARRAAAKHGERNQLLAEWSRFSQETGRERLVDDHRPLEALPYLVAAREAIEASGGRPTPSLRMLFADAARDLPLSEPLLHAASVVGAVFSPDGRLVATASDDHTARIWIRSALSGNDGTATVRSAAASIFEQAPLTLTLPHRAGVSSVAFSSVGDRVVTASKDHTASVWSVVTGQRLAGPFMHLDAVNDAEFSSDGTRVVTASDDRMARIWDAATGQLVATLVHTEAVHAAVFNRDGTLVITTSDNTAQVWSTVSYRRRFPPLTHEGAVNSATFSPNGCCIVTASEDRTAQIWDAATGKPMSAPLRHHGAVHHATFSADSARVVTASADHTARVWSAGSGQPVSPPLVHEDAVRSAAFSPDGTVVATAGGDHTARIWDAASGALLSTSFHHQARVRAVAFNFDGSELVTASDDHTARVWHATRLAPPFEHGKPVQSAVFSPDATRVVTASWDHTAQVWDARSRAPIAPPLRHDDALQSAVFSPDGMRVATASWDRTARVWDAASGAPITRPLVHHDVVVSVGFSPDGARIVTASWDHTARVWDARSGQPLGPALQHAAAIYMAMFSPDGGRIVTASSDHTARVWDASTGKPLSPPLTHLDAVRSAAFSADGQRVVTASSDHTARIWDALTGAAVTPPLEHDGPVDSAVFDTTGTQIVTASRDHSARIWDARSGTLVATPLLHSAGVWSAVFSSDGTRVLTASQDGTARIWDAISAQPLSSAFVHRGPVWSAAFRPDDGAVLTASDDGTARIWELPRAPATLAEWRMIAGRVSPYVLVNGVLSSRGDAQTGATGFTQMGE